MTGNSDSSNCSSSVCACGYPDGTNWECERCILISQTKSMEKRISGLEFGIGTHKDRIRAQVECIECLKSDYTKSLDALGAINKHIASAKDSIQRSVEYSLMMRDAYANANGDLDKTAQWHYWMGRMQAQNEILVQWIDPEMEDCAYCGKKCRVNEMYRPRELITDDLVCSGSCAEAFNDRHVEP